MVADRRGEFALAKGQAIAGAIDKVAGAFTQAITEGIGNKEKAAALDASMDLINQKAPNLLPPDFIDKFHGAGVGAKAGMMATVQAVLQREDQMTPPAPVVPQYGKTPAGAGYFSNPRTGAITPESNINPPLPVDSGIPTADGKGNILVNSKSGAPFVPPEPPPVLEWREAEGGTMQHYKNGMPTGAMYKKPGKAGMVELEGAPGIFLKVGPDGKPLENGRSYKAQSGPFSEGLRRFTAVDEPAQKPTPSRIQKITNPDGTQTLLEEKPDGTWVQIVPGAAAAAPSAPAPVKPVPKVW